MAPKSTAGPSRKSTLRNRAEVVTSDPTPGVSPSDLMPDVSPSNPIPDVAPIELPENDSLDPQRSRNWRHIGDVPGYAYYLSPDARVHVRRHRNRQEVFSDGPDTPMASEEATRTHEAAVEPPINELPVRLVSHLFPFPIASNPIPQSDPVTATDLSSDAISSTVSQWS
jgi:hypothetical protein